jgi:hypothetical protein
LTLCYQSPQIRGQDDDLNGPRCFGSANLSVTPTGDAPIQARDYGGGAIAVDVPASFTSGVLTFRGPEDLGDGTTLRLSKPLSISFAIPG